MSLVTGADLTVWGIRYILGGVLLFAAVAKARDGASFQRALAMVFGAHARMLMWGLIAVELVTGLLLFGGSQATAGLLATCLFTGFLAARPLFGSTGCHCWGSLATRRGSRLGIRPHFVLSRLSGLLLGVGLWAESFLPHSTVLLAFFGVGASMWVLSLVGPAAMRRHPARSVDILERPSGQTPRRTARRDVLRWAVLGGSAAALSVIRAPFAYAACKQNTVNTETPTTDTPVDEVLQLGDGCNRRARCICNCCYWAELCKADCESRYANCMERANSDEERRQCKQSWEVCDNVCEKELDECIVDCRRFDCDPSLDLV